MSEPQSNLAHSSQALPNRVRIYEVGPRDGLQNEARFVPTEDKIELIEALLDAGLPMVEATSFVHPRWIPALADADQVAAHFQDHPSADQITALVPNARGLSRAQEARCREVAVFMSASETHNKRNINKSREETYQAFEPVFAACAERGVRVRAYVSVVWGCPYEGKVSAEAGAEVAERLLEMGAYEISLGDTIGVGNPRQTREVIETIARRVPLDRIALHMHDTWGRALANCLVGLDMGIRTFDASIGGLGGCPYAPGASGNLATEDLVAMIHEMGYQTGIDWDRLVKAGRRAQDLLGRTLPSRALRAALSSCDDQ
jgi:hydroxymethylglutaryl-CoA lyase